MLGHKKTCASFILWSSNIFRNHTNGRMLNEELYSHRIQVNFCAVFTQLLHKDFTLLIRIQLQLLCMKQFILTSEEKSL